MSFDPSSSDLQLIWDIFIEFESFSREADGDLNYFIEKWKEKMDKAMSAGIQFSDLLLGLKLIEKANLSQEYIGSLFSKLSSSNSTSVCFLAQVVSNIKEPREYEFIVSEVTESTNEENYVSWESNSNIASCSKCSLDFFDADNLSKHYHEFHSEAENDTLNASEMELDIEHVKSLDCGLISVSETVIQVLSDLPESGEEESPKYDYHDGDELRLEIMSGVGFQSFTRNHQSGNSLDTNTHPGGAFKNNFCQKEFTRALDLQHHKDSHTIRIKCYLCETTFNSKSRMNDHVKKIHGHNYDSTEGDAEVEKHLLTERFIYGERTEKNENHISKNLDEEEISVELESNSSIVSCSKCPETFLDKDSLSKHFCSIQPKVKEKVMAIHSEKESNYNSGLLECPYCDKSFTLLKTLEVHLKSHESVIKVWSDSLESPDITVRGDDEDKKRRCNVIKSNCKICARLISNANMAKHMQTHTRDPVKCSICQKEFKEAKYLRQHLQYCNPTWMECPICDKMLKTKNEMRIHLKRIHNEKNITTERDTEDKKCSYSVMKSICELCSRPISNANMANHLKAHTRDPFRCNICQKEFKESKNLRQHMGYHNPARIKCPFCDEMLKTKLQLIRHVKKLHEKKNTGGDIEEEKCGSKRKNNVQYPCEICGKCVDKRSLSIHMKIHKTFKCSICQKQFKTKGHLQQHLPTHNATNEFACSICGKKYKTKMSLYEHNMSQHSNKRPLPCKFCKKVFFSYGLRTFHIRSQHTGEKPYKCDFCDKRFYISSRKTQHMKYHTDEKPYQCHICGKYFKEKNTRKRHIRNIHKEVNRDEV